MPSSPSGPHRLLRLLALGAVCALLSACPAKRIGVGVLLWSPDEGLVPSGAVVDVISGSDLGDTYTVASEALEEQLRLPRWRVEFFDDPQEAVSFAERYRSSLGGNAGLYARALRNALPIRSEPRSATGNIVYRLRLEEQIKLIHRESEQTNLEGLVSYWYEALTETGVRGWVFGYTLEVFDARTDAVVSGVSGPEDPLFELLLGNVWRPIYFLDMIASGAIDLELFRPEYGLFPDRDANQLSLVTPHHATIFEYERIANVGSRRYLAEGTTLQLTFQRNDELAIQYLLDGRQYILALQRVSGEIESYIEAELERRARKFDALFTRGPTYASDNYGRLEFLEGDRFTWTGYFRLVPAVVPQGVGTTGRVDYGYYLASALRGTYDGALSFVFDGATTPATFAYAFRDGGVRLVYVPPADTRDRIVRREGVSPLTIFMSSIGG